MNVAEAKSYWELALDMWKKPLGQAIIIAGIVGFSTWYVMNRRLEIELENSLRKDAIIAEAKTEITFWRDAFLKADEGCIERFKAMQVFSQSLADESERINRIVENTLKKATHVLEGQREILNGLKND